LPLKKSFEKDAAQAFGRLKFLPSLKLREIFISLLFNIVLPGLGFFVCLRSKLLRLPE
jgi:hypothetical protein